MTTDTGIAVSQPSVSAGAALVRQLQILGKQRVYCVPGESFLAVIDGLYAHRGSVQMISCRHEGGAAMMAVAEGHLTGEPGVCFVTRGPGATNASIAVHIARQASIPLVLCVGQVARGNLGRESFQEIDYEQFFAPLAKRVSQIDDPADAQAALADAVQLSKNGRAGPVVLAFPEDVLTAPVGVTSQVEAPAAQAVISVRETSALLERLAKAHRPLILVGGTQWDSKSCRQLEDFVLQNAIPVFAAFRRNDVVSNLHSSYAGYLGLNQHTKAREHFDAADLIVVLGARLDEPTTAGYALFDCERDQSRVVHVHCDREVLLQSAPFALSVHADVAPVLATLNAAGSLCRAVEHQWCGRCRSDYLDSLAEPYADKFDGQKCHLPKLMAAFNATVPSDTVVTIDAGNFTLWPQRLRQYQRPGRLLGPVNGAMGYGVPAAIAASLNQPDTPVVAFVGDGGMLMTGMELATAVKYGATPVILVFNNAKYGTIDSHQRRQYPGRLIGNDLHNPDFVRFADSFGAFARRVRDHAQFAEALEQALNAGRAALIEIELS